jgi:hypothetical protein
MEETAAELAHREEEDPEIKDIIYTREDKSGITLPDDNPSLVNLTKKVPVLSLTEAN